MHFSAWDSSFFFIKYGARPFFARPILGHKFFHYYFLYYCVFKMKLNNFIVGSFLIGIGLVIGLAMMFLNRKNLWSFRG